MNECHHHALADITHSLEQGVINETQILNIKSKDQLFSAILDKTANIISFNSWSALPLSKLLNFAIILELARWIFPESIKNTQNQCPENIKASQFTEASKWGTVHRGKQMNIEASK